MTESQKSCPKCHGVMEQGFIPDVGDANVRQTSKWYEGQPEKSFWVGVKTSGKRQFQVQSYRCENCGYLESYAV